MGNTKLLDVICLGRAAVDLYGQQIGSRLEDMTSFAKYLGGSSGNIAVGTARLGLKSAMLTRVGDEHLGRFVKQELYNNGVDVSHVHQDPNRLTGLAILAIKDKDTFPLVFYRNDCADMAIQESDFSKEFISSSKSLLITGTHLSQKQSLKVCKKAIEYAKESGTKFVLDIDYRPVLWGLSGLGDGETRFISNETVSSRLQAIIPHCDLIVGTEEEIHIAGGDEDTIIALKNIRRISKATILLKLGPLGCTVIDDEIPSSEKDFDIHFGIEVDVLNVLGAGDAFLSGFLRGWLREQPNSVSCKYANACGAIVVSRHGCTPASPSEEELRYFLGNANNIKNVAKDEELNYLHRVTTSTPRVSENLCIMAFDHRKQFHDMAIECGADLHAINKLKSLLTQAVKVTEAQKPAEINVGVLIDDTFGQDALNESTGKGWWIGRPVELPGSIPLELEGGRDISARLASWPAEHVVKCLVFYHPEDQISLQLAQERQIKELYAACCLSGHQLLLEIIPPNTVPNDDTTIIKVMQRFINLGVKPDWWKLPATTELGWSRVE
ncbi:5-dehydro-2-deoxygluconokinase, partial [Alteromonas macleodii]|uniref:bifunctional 5-dehydro-2-deoxygluconokinase/5-dehydro-2- deoxyphosphogluconate aldolase n=1 Tax=Alteromonas macleodii TaxID=28108 RepID=UPI00057E5286